MSWHLFRRYQENSPIWRRRRTSHENNQQSVRLCLFVFLKIIYLFFIIILIRRERKAVLDPFVSSQGVAMRMLSPAVRFLLKSSSARRGLRCSWCVLAEIPGHQRCRAHKSCLFPPSSRPKSHPFKDLGPRLDRDAKAGGWGVAISPTVRADPPGAAAGLGPPPLLPRGAPRAGDRSPGWGRSSISHKRPVQKAAPRWGRGLPGRAVPHPQSPLRGRRLRLGSERAASSGSASSRPPAASPGILHPHPPLLPAPAVKATPRRGPGMPSPSPPLLSLPSSRSGGGGL